MDYIALAKQYSQAYLPNNTPIAIIPTATPLVEVTVDNTVGISANVINITGSGSLSPISLQSDIITKDMVVNNQNADRDRLVGVKISSINLIPNAEYSSDTDGFAYNLKSSESLPPSKTITPPTTLSLPADGDLVSNLATIAKTNTLITRSSVNIDMIKNEINKDRYVRCFIALFDEALTRYYLLSGKIPTPSSTSIRTGTIPILISGYDDVNQRLNIILPIQGLKLSSLKYSYIQDPTISTNFYTE